MLTKDLARLDKGALRRLKLLRSDVREVTSPRVDIACAMNLEPRVVLLGSLLPGSAEGPLQPRDVRL